MVKLTNSFSTIKPFRALVLGDFMLDTYTTGRVRRISPEAPVPVMEVFKQESRPGGAGNVVLNLATLGADVIAVGRIGEDEAGRELSHRLGSHLFVEPGYKTPVKNRLISDSQQLLRVDMETITPLLPDLEPKVLSLLEQIIPTVQVVAISDYGKGFLTPSILSAAIQIGKKTNVPVVIDPKGIEFAKYRDATMIKPNLSEAYAAAKLPPTATLDEVAAALLDLTQVDTLLITRSEAGISIFNRDGRTDYPVRSKEVKDVTGAGDTVLATLCLGLANHLDLSHTVQLANISAGLSIERLGCVQITLAEIARRLLEFDADTKIFDENHTYALHQVLKDRRYTLLHLEPHQQMNTTLFRTIRDLSKPNQDLLLYTQGLDGEVVHLLSSLSEVNFIIFETDTLENLCQSIHPHEIYHLHNNHLHKLNHAKELLVKLKGSSRLQNVTD
jgi:rfaE bifunctional protein kinase chain/domain